MLAAGGGRHAQAIGDPRADRRRGGGTGHAVPDDARRAAADPHPDRAAGRRAARSGCAIARIVRESDQTVRTWLKRWLAEGLAGLQDRPLPERPAKITAAYRERLLAV